MSARRRDESRRSTQECVRHEGVFMTFGGPAGLRESLPQVGVRVLRPQRGHWIDFCSAVGGDEAGRGCRDCHQHDRECD
jgi:hypothetical protein